MFLFLINDSLSAIAIYFYISKKNHGDGKECPLFLKKVMHACSISNDKLDYTEKVITCQLEVLLIIAVHWNLLYFSAIRFYVYEL